MKIGERRGWRGGMQSNPERQGRQKCGVQEPRPRGSPLCHMKGFELRDAKVLGLEFGHVQELDIAGFVVKKRFVNPS